MPKYRATSLLDVVCLNLSVAIIPHAGRSSALGMIPNESALDPRFVVVVVIDVVSKLQQRAFQSTKETLRALEHELPLQRLYVFSPPSFEPKQAVSIFKSSHASRSNKYENTGSAVLDRREQDLDHIRSSQSVATS